MTSALAAPASPRCFSFIGTRGIRVTMLDTCGRPVWGDATQAVSRGVISVEFEPETEDGEEYSQVNAAGEQCFPPFTGPSSIKWWNVNLTFCNVDPDLFLIIQRTWKRVTDYTRKATTGMRFSNRLDDRFGFALETWPKAAGSGVGGSCLDDADGGNLPPDYEPGGYILVPWLVPVAPDSLTLENEPTEVTLQCKSKVGGLWGRGPYNVVRDEAGDAAPLLDPIDPGFDVPAWNLISSGDPDPIHWELTTVAPPVAKCGAQPLWNPNGTAPVIEVTAASETEKDKAKLTVTNFDAIGKAGTVDWGDSTRQPVPTSSNGTVTKTAVYPPGAIGHEQTVTFTPANGAKPVTATFTPQSNALASGVLPATGSTVEPHDDTDAYTIAVTLDDPPDGDIAIDWGDDRMDIVRGAGPHRHTYREPGMYPVVTSDTDGTELTRDSATVPTTKE